MRINGDGVLTLCREDLEIMMETLDNAPATFISATWEAENGMRISFEEEDPTF